MQTRAKLDFDAEDILAHLQRVLGSDAFRTSRRSQDFLRFVVTRTLEGRDDFIKERNIAVEAFGRPLDYNSAEDSYVRVKASEVRRRLAAYYASASAEDRISIELPLGSYVPRFAVIESPVAAQSAPSDAPSAGTPSFARRPGKRLAIAAIVAVCIFSLTAATLTIRSSTSPLDEFWAPILRTSEPLIIYLPFPTSFAVVGEDAALRTGAPVPQVIFPSGRHAFLAETPHKVGVGAAVGAIRFATLCVQTGKSYTLKGGDDFSFADLRNQPAVLFGAFSSRWTVEMNNEHRFKLMSGPTHILDGHDPARRWQSTPGRYPGTPLEDYAIASRVIDSKSGRTVILAAGISTFGTQAAAEFLTDPRRLAELTKRAPHPLSRGNFQVLLHTKIIGNTPTPGRVVDVHFW